MSNRESDILQIKKYLNGELDAKAMHQLERQALDDPFLMDAMEGYERAGRNQDPQLNSLSARLQARVSPKQKKIFPFYFIAIAASVLIVFTVGGLLLFNNRPQQKQLVAKLEKSQSPAKTDSVQKATIEYKKAEPNARAENFTSPPRSATVRRVKVTPDAVAVQEPVAAADSKAAAPNTEISADDNASPEEMVVLGMQADKKVNQVHLRSKADTNPNTLLETKVPGLTKTEAEGRNLYGSLNRNFLQGRVFARDNGLPLTGASVRVEGTNKTAVTDVEGKFTIPFDSNKQNRLLVASIGYETREVVAKNRDSLKSITLDPNSSSLSEVVVTGYAPQKATIEDSLVKSHPKAGWADFRKYLRKNAVSPDGKAGVVKLSFQVNHDGSITGITVTKSLSPASDQKAIDLINNGPEWLGNKNGLPETVQVRIKF